MKPEELYENLKQLAQNLEITVSEENLKRSGVKIKSGFCKVKGNNLFVLDKRLKIQQKVECLSEFLHTMPHEDIYVVPAVRDLLNRYDIKTPPDTEIGSRGESVLQDHERRSDDN